MILANAPPFLIQSASSPKPRGMAGKVMIKRSSEHPISDKAVARFVFSGLAVSVIFLSQSNEILAADLPRLENVCQLANASDSTLTLPLDEGARESGGRLMMMRGMTAANFDPIRYSGRWFEVASLKRGFAGQGQEDCHCTQVKSSSLNTASLQKAREDYTQRRSSIEPPKVEASCIEKLNTVVLLLNQAMKALKGVYTFDMEAPAIQVDTFCVHGGPDGYITGIRGKVQCLSEEDVEKNETDVERQEMIKEKCYLRFPTLPFIPKEPYDVIATDYDNFALVSGAKDRSFIQIYSRTPNPGPKFIETYKNYLANFGYDRSKIKETPQDCEVKSNSQLAAMMSMSGMQQALTNQFPDLELKAPVAFNPFTSVFDTLKKLVELYFK